MCVPHFTKGTSTPSNFNTPRIRDGGNEFVRVYITNKKKGEEILVFGELKRERLKKRTSWKVLLGVAFFK